MAGPASRSWRGRQHLATFGDLFGQPLTLKEMSPYLPAVSLPRTAFYQHFGIDPVGLLRAAFADLRGGHPVQGGSTITQQLAKTVFLTPSATLSRKVARRCTRYG